MSKTVGFTGTRSITLADMPIIRQIVTALPDNAHVITGACIGVDAAVARVARQRGLHVHTVVPADRSRVDPHWRDYCTTFEEMPPGTDYRARNTRIVELSTDIIAIADRAEDDPKSRRSGTWMTVRIARKAGKPVDEHVLSANHRPTPARPSEASGE